MTGDWRRQRLNNQHLKCGMRCAVELFQKGKKQNNPWTPNYRANQGNHMLKKHGNHCISLKLLNFWYFLF